VVFVTVSSVNLYEKTLQHSDLLMLLQIIRYLAIRWHTINSIILVRGIIWTSTFIQNLNLAWVNALNYNQLNSLYIMLVNLHEVILIVLECHTLDYHYAECTW